MDSAEEVKLAYLTKVLRPKMSRTALRLLCRNPAATAAELQDELRTSVFNSRVLAAYCLRHGLPQGIIVPGDVHVQPAAPLPARQAPVPSAEVDDGWWNKNKKKERRKEEEEEEEEEENDNDDACGDGSKHAKTAKKKQEVVENEMKKKK